jgi:hypothetical protein
MKTKHKLKTVKKNKGREATLARKKRNIYKWRRGLRDVAEELVPLSG